MFAWESQSLRGSGADPAQRKITAFASRPGASVPSSVLGSVAARGSGIAFN